MIDSSLSKRYESRLRTFRQTQKFVGALYRKQQSWWHILQRTFQSIRILTAHIKIQLISPHFLEFFDVDDLFQHLCGDRPEFSRADEQSGCVGARRTSTRFFEQVRWEFQISLKGKIST